MIDCYFRIRDTVIAKTSCQHQSGPNIHHLVLPKHAWTIPPSIRAGMLLTETCVCSLPIFVGFPTLKSFQGPKKNSWAVLTALAFQSSNILGSNFGRHRLPLDECVLMCSIYPQKWSLRDLMHSLVFTTQRIFIRTSDKCEWMRLWKNTSQVVLYGAPLLSSLPFFKHYFHGFLVS